MRNLFFAVLAANFFIFMFYYYLPEGQSESKLVIPAGTQKLVLLSEVDKASLTNEQDGAEKTDIKPEAVKNKPIVKRCFTIGPFREENKINAFEKLIKKKVKKTGVRERVEKQHWRYWVFLPPAKSRTKAVNLAADLAKKGLKDYYVIARGEFVNAVSLGHFKDKSLAENRYELIKKMGYQPKMNAIEKEYTLYWLDYESRDGHGLSNQALNSFELEESIHQFNRECLK